MSEPEQFKDEVRDLPPVQLDEQDSSGRTSSLIAATSLFHTQFADLNEWVSREYETCNLRGCEPDKVLLSEMGK
jgi:hypothetical protein